MYVKIVCDLIDIKKNDMVPVYVPCVLFSS